MNQRGEHNSPSCLEYVILLVIGIVVVVGAFQLLSPQIATIYHPVNSNLDSDMELNGIDVSVQTPPEVTVNHPFTVTASISASRPLTALTSNGGQDLGNPSANLQGESLADILRPPSAGSYSLCLIVDLHFDDDAAFDFTKYSTPDTEQKFTLVPDVTTAVTAQWTVTPQDTSGLETVAHDARIRVWLDAETTCRVGTGSLLDDSFYLENVPPPAQFTVINEDLIQQRALTARLQPIALATVAAVTIASVAWAAGFFAWVRRRPRARRKHDASENVPHRRAATRLRFSVVVPGGALLSIGVVLITLGPSTVVYYLGTDAALVSFFGGIIVACVGILFLAMGVRRIRFASSA